MQVYENALETAGLSKLIVQGLPNASVGSKRRGISSTGWALCVGVLFRCYSDTNPMISSKVHLKVHGEIFLGLDEPCGMEPV
jgi:hypothetical protein